MEKNGLRRLEGKRGFTMVELLAVIVILGILTTISIVGIQRIMGTAKQKYYESQEQSMVAAARNFSEKNKQYLPKINGHVSNVSLKKLVDSKYIEKVVDYSKKNCSEDDSFVQIFYYDNEYQYLPYLKCETWSSKDITNNQDIQFDFTFSGDVTNATLKYKVEDQTNGLATYYYTIYSNDKVVYTSEKYIVNTKSVEKTISLTEYIPGNIKIVMTGVSQKGMSNSNSATHSYGTGSDSATVQCGTVTGESTSWTTGNRKITVACIDATNGIKCARSSFTKEFTTSKKTGTITIKDKEGNSVDCPVNVYVDKDNPTVTSIAVTSRVSGYNSRSAKVTVKGSDTTSGLKSLCYSLTNNSSGCTWKNVPAGTTEVSWEITLSQADGSGATQSFYAFAKDNADRISTSKSTSYRLYKFCSQKGDYKCGKSSTGPGVPNIQYYHKYDDVCNQPGTNNGWGLKKVKCPYFDKYFPTEECEEYEIRACPCDTCNGTAEGRAVSDSVRGPDCNSLYCQNDVCKPEYCFNTANRGRAECHD